MIFIYCELSFVLAPRPSSPSLGSFYQKLKKTWCFFRGEDNVGGNCSLLEQCSASNPWAEIFPLPASLFPTLASSEAECVSLYGRKFLRQRFVFGNFTLVGGRMVQIRAVQSLAMEYCMVGLSPQRYLSGNWTWNYKVFFPEKTSSGLRISLSIVL